MDKVLDKNGKEIRAWDTVVIPKGTTIRGIAEGAPKAAGRARRVKIHDVFPSTAGIEGGVPWHRPAEVMWAGAGGIWNYAYAHDVEVVEKE